MKAGEAIEELTLMLMYLTRFTDGQKFREATDFYAWKGYNFDTINKLDEIDLIRQSSRKSKSVYLTEEGKARAKELLNKYGIEDW